MNNPGLPIQNLGGGLFIALAPVRAPRPQLQQPVEQAAALMQVAIDALPAAIALAPVTPGVQLHPAGQAAAAVLPDLQVPAAPRAGDGGDRFFRNAAVPDPFEAFAPSTPPQLGRKSPR